MSDCGKELPRHSGEVERDVIAGVMQVPVAAADPLVTDAGDEIGDHLDPVFAITP